MTISNADIFYTGIGVGGEGAEDVVPDWY